MTGTVIKQDNQLMIKVKHPTYGSLILPPDKESRLLLEVQHVHGDVEGDIVTSVSNIEVHNVKFNVWQFHIESFNIE
jgi:hypothetical protein